MVWEPIIKSECAWRVVPNLQDNEQGRAAFSWDQARGELDGLPGGQGLNIAHGVKAPIA
jgi:acetyl-CoA synthetase